MEEVRYSKRLRAARDAAAAEKSGKSEKSEALVGNLIADNVDRPVYHPRFGTVMSPEQLETLKRQITVYATICQQLVELHKASVAAAAVQDSNGNGGGKREPATVVKTGAPRHRWSPSQNQLVVLESFYNSSSGATPNKQKVREIAAQLSMHGTITETNVYNWFQNRKARFRRLRNQQASKEPDSEGDTKPVSPLGDTDASNLANWHSVSESKAAEGEEQQLSQVHINGELSEVPAGVFSVRDRFGERAALMSKQGEAVSIDGDEYSLSENTEAKSLSENTEAKTVGDESILKVFAKRSTLPLLTPD